jgi:HK97 family phage major capsid protein
MSLHEKTHPRFKNFGEFLLGCAADEVLRSGSTVTGDARRLAGLVAAAGSDELSTLSPVPVPQQFSDVLLERMFDFSRVAKRCRKVPVGNDGVQLPAFRESSRADGSRLGGISSYWLAETQAPQVSRTAFQQIKQNTGSLVVLVPVTEELVARVPALGETLMQAAAEEIAVVTDSAIIQGNGVGKPCGILNDSCVIEVAKESGQAAGTILRENVLKMLERLWPYSDPNAVWFCSRSAQRALLNSTAEDLINPSDGVVRFSTSSTESAMSLCGLPLIVLEQCPAAGQRGDLILADCTQYVLGDRGAVRRADSLHVRFENHERVFKFWYETDGRPIWKDAVAAMNGADQSQSPFVVLEART